MVSRMVWPSFHVADDARVHRRHHVAHPAHTARLLPSVLSDAPSTLAQGHGLPGRIAYLRADAHVVVYRGVWRPLHVVRQSAHACAARHCHRACGHRALSHALLPLPLRGVQALHVSQRGAYPHRHLLCRTCSRCGAYDGRDSL